MSRGKRGPIRSGERRRVRRAAPVQLLLDELAPVDDLVFDVDGALDELESPDDDEGVDVEGVEVEGDDPFVSAELEPLVELFDELEPLRLSVL